MTADQTAQPLDLDAVLALVESYGDAREATGAAFDCFSDAEIAKCDAEADELFGAIRAEVERLRAIVEGATVREEFGTRITWPDGKVEDRWCYRDRADAAAQVGWFAETIPHAVPGGSLYGATVALIRRLHLTLAAETVEEQR